MAQVNKGLEPAKSLGKESMPAKSPVSLIAPVALPPGASAADRVIKIEVSPAELIDRLTILEIKLDRICDAQKRGNVEIEHAVVQAAYEAHMPASATLAALIDKLREVNLGLWTIEDDIRDCERRQEFGPTFLTLARSVYLSNDRRSELKREINALLGSKLREEKSYTLF
jgi:hypothetical protein